MTASRAILHVDMDAFYASIEQRDDPALRGRPIVVGGLGRRGVVSTASYEARRFGVRSAMPMARARRLCPHAVFLAPRLSHYATVAREVLAVLGEYTPLIEPLSLDEAFLDVTGSLRLHGAAPAIGAAIRARLRQRLGLACSVGVAHNKLLAKLASELAKPDGLRQIEAHEVGDVLGPLPVARLWTIGPVTAARLEAAGIVRIAALAATPAARLSRIVGRDAARLLALARGEDDRPVVPVRTERSISAERTFDTDLTTLAAARAWLMRLSERVGERARSAGLAGRRITLKLRLPSFETHTRQAMLPRPSGATAALHAVADRLLARWWAETTDPRLRLLGVGLSSLTGAAASGTGADLFDRGQRAADAVVDRINHRFGAAAVRRARGLAAPGAD